MKVSYTGIKHGLPAKLQDKLDTKFAKLSKLVDGRGEKQAHVVVTSERHLHKAEITLHIHNHQLVGIGSDSDVFKAMSAALDRIEKQAAKEGAKWRETTRRSDSIKAMDTKDAQPGASKPLARSKSAPGKAGAGCCKFRCARVPSPASRARQAHHARRSAARDGRRARLRGLS
jgi:ribosomal subunit interface protein